MVLRNLAQMLKGILVLGVAAGAFLPSVARAQGGEAFLTVQRIVHEAVSAGVPAQPSENALMTLIWSVGHGLACLLLDGPLGHKHPNTAPEHIDAVLGELNGLLEASLAQAVEPPTT